MSRNNNQMNDVQNIVIVESILSVDFLAWENSLMAKLFQIMVKKFLHF